MTARSETMIQNNQEGTKTSQEKMDAKIDANQ
jgi:hypothetical protein